MNDEPTPRNISDKITAAPDFSRAQRDAERIARKYSPQQLAALTAALMDELVWESTGRFYKLADCYRELQRAAQTKTLKKI